MRWSLLALCLACSHVHSTRFVEYEAEDQPTSGSLIGPSRAFGTIAAEASGRRAVLLASPAQFIRFRLTAPARGLTVRYSVPASPTGDRQASALAIEADGRRVAKIMLRSHYTARPVAHPSAPDFLAHHFWEETRVLLPGQVPAGTTLLLRLARGGGARSLVIDLVDAEQVGPPKPSPDGAVSVLSLGADPSGRRSSRIAFIQAMAVARRRHRSVYLPPGRYNVDGHLTVDQAKIVGAGSWYTIISGHDLGFYSRPDGSSSVSLSDFAVESDIWKRQDRLPLAAIGGTFNDSSFTKLYLHHAKVGIWLDGPARDLVIRDVEIADQTADGINLHRGIRNATIEHNRIRNVGDDAIASWSDSVANEDILIRSNRITMPGLANGIALYGGRDINVVGNRVADVLTEGGGIHLGARFGSAPFSGRILVADNTIIRAATLDPNWHFGVGAIWIYALERPIQADIRVVRNRIVDANCEAIQLLGPNRIDGLSVDGLQIDGAVSLVFALQTAGSLRADAVVSQQVPIRRKVGVPKGFKLLLGTGNHGWSFQSVRLPIAPSCI